MEISKASQFANVYEEILSNWHKEYVGELLKYARDREAVIEYNRERVLKDDGSGLD